eukprot:1094037_1
MNCLFGNQTKMIAVTQTRPIRKPWLCESHKELGIVTIVFMLVISTLWIVVIQDYTVQCQSSPSQQEDLNPKNGKKSPKQYPKHFMSSSAIDTKSTTKINLFPIVQILILIYSGDK